MCMYIYIYIYVYIYIEALQKLENPKLPQTLNPIHGSPRTPLHLIPKP